MRRTRSAPAGPSPTRRAGPPTGPLGTRGPRRRPPCPPHGCAGRGRRPRGRPRRAVPDCSRAPSSHAVFATGRRRGSGVLGRGTQRSETPGGHSGVTSMREGRVHDMINRATPGYTCPTTLHPVGPQSWTEVPALLSYEVSDPFAVRITFGDSAEEDGISWLVGRDLAQGGR